MRGIDGNLTVLWGVVLALPPVLLGMAAYHRDGPGRRIARTLARAAIAGAGIQWVFLGGLLTLAPGTGWAGLTADPPGWFLRQPTPVKVHAAVAVLTGLAGVLMLGAVEREILRIRALDHLRAERVAAARARNPESKPVMCEVSDARPLPTAAGASPAPPG